MKQECERDALYVNHDLTFSDKINTLQYMNHICQAYESVNGMHYHLKTSPACTASNFVAVKEVTHPNIHTAVCFFFTFLYLNLV